LSVKINSLKFSYEGFSLEADLEIPAGEFLSILGPSGSGKTTLLRLIAGFQLPASGEIILEGSNITAIPTSRRNIGMVFQDYALFPHMDVFHNIAYGLQSSKAKAKTKADRDSIRARVSELLELVELSGYEKRRIGELSGGEKQRVALARALAPEPKLLLFDEPLSALDVKLRKGLRREIKRIQTKVGFTAVYVTHDQEEAMSISDRIAVMNGGRIVQTGSPEELYYHPADYFTADFIGTMNRINCEGGIMFRPESCRLAVENEMVTEKDERLVLSAAVISAEFAGGFYICEAETENDEMITFHSGRKPETGSRVQILVDRAAITSCC